VARVISNKEVQVVRLQKNLYNLKDQAHKYFDQLWQHKYLTRQQAYDWLAQQLGVPEPQAHMSTMDIEMCKQVVENAIMVLNDMRRLDLDWGDPIKHPYYQLERI